MKKYIAEFIGTFWLVFASVGSALFACNVANTGIGFLGVSLAFGISLMAMAFAIGHISGCHINPAVTLGLWAGNRLECKQVIPYIVVQVLGGVAGAAVLYFIFTGKAGLEPITAFASNGYGEHSPEGYSLLAVGLAEFVVTGFFIFIIMGATDSRAPKGLAPIAIGATLTLAHLILIPISNASVNPARSTATAVIDLFVSAEAWSIGQLWIFWVAPILGGLFAGRLYRCLLGQSEDGVCACEK